MIKKFVTGILMTAMVAMLYAANREEASFVWADQHGEGRQMVVFFRNDFDLDEMPKEAVLNLFADSRYQLFVNGIMINFGPARFYPAHPQYDSYSLLPWLKKGKNTIGVKVMSNGVHTYQIPKHTGGFIAWGDILCSGGKKISLVTPGNWICLRSEGYDREMPKVSFALQICESYDARKDPPDWNLPSADTRQWKKVTRLSQQDKWGPLEPRTIPHLTQEDIRMKKLLGVYSLKDDADMISYRVKVPDEEEKLYRTSHRLFAYTYIYSPRNQKADITGWWSELWLNGDSAGYTQPEGGLPARYWHLNLKEGWNYLFVKYGTVDGIWEANYKVPKKYGLKFSAVRDTNSPITFYTAGPFTDKEKEKIMSLPLPINPSQLPKLSAGWKPHYRSEICHNPVWEIALSDLGEKQEGYHPSHCGPVVISRPSAILYDVGGKQLARFSIDIEAPEGTIVDVAFTEDTIGKRPWVMKRRMIYMGTRFITREGMNHFETFNPYGTRFVHINILNNQNKTVTLHQVKMISQVYPFTKTGSFECSDPLMNALWEMGWRTLRVCSEDSYVDTPFRERGLYAGDALPEYATTLATAGDSRLIKRCLELFQDMYAPLFTGTDGKEKLGDFPLITTLYWAWYLNRTNDKHFAGKLYPAYKNMITRIGNAHTQPNGLIEADYVFVEWTKIRRNNYSNTFFNALYARNCELLAMIAGQLGHKDDSVWFSTKARQVIHALQTCCWDDRKGAYYDGIAKDTPVKSYYPISSAIMSLFGYTTPQQEEKLKIFYEETLKDIGSKVRDGLATSYGGFYVLGALYRQGYAGRAEHFIRRYYSPMLFYLDDTMWEDFAENSELLTSGTLSHAWSSAPTYYMTTEVLGVKLGFPELMSADSILIAPQAENITWARGNVPHPKGNIYVDWHIKGNALYVNYTAPEGLTIKVQPRGKLATLALWVNGSQSTDHAQTK